MNFAVAQIAKKIEWQRLVQDNAFRMKSFLQRVGSNRLLRAQTFASFRTSWDS
jgi:hypothetical protein